jgi:hypothetical protein
VSTQGSERSSGVERPWAKLLCLWLFGDAVVFCDAGDESAGAHAALYGMGIKLEDEDVQISG